MKKCNTCGQTDPARFSLRATSTCRSCKKAANAAYQSTPVGWSRTKVNSKRDTNRAARAGITYNKIPADQLLNKALATTGHCDVTGRFCGLPWNHVGDKHAGLEMDHILSIPVCKAAGIEWNTIDNIQFIYKGVHSKKSSDETRARAVIMQSLPYYTVPERASVEWSI